MGFMYWAGLPAAARGLEYHGLVHAADWLPTVLSAVTGGGAPSPGETLPLDGVDVWGALLGNSSSPRSEIYYGINQAGGGPAVRGQQKWMTTRAPAR